MDEAHYGIIELGLVFGIVLGWAVWETVRTRRGLARMRRQPGK